MADRNAQLEVFQQCDAESPRHCDRSRLGGLDSLDGGVVSADESEHSHRYGKHRGCPEQGSFPCLAAS